MSRLTAFNDLMVFGMTHPGLMRDKNEDSLFVNQELRIMSVADGMGGAAAGEIASDIFMQTVKDLLKKPVTSQEQAIQLIKKIFLTANQSIIETARQNPHYKGMGCTAELLIFSHFGYVLGHVGDSRSYLFRQGDLKQMTKDHSVVQEQIDQGLISAAEASNHPLKNVIVRAVGTDESIAVDLIRGYYHTGDIFLLCSDGLHDMVPDETITRILRTYESPELMCQALIGMANKAGGKDNITVAIGQIK